MEVGARNSATFEHPADLGECCTSELCSINVVKCKRSVISATYLQFSVDAVSRHVDLMSAVEFGSGRARPVRLSELCRGVLPGFS